MVCNLCYNPIERRKGPCVFYQNGAAPIERQKEDGMKGILFTMNGKVYHTTTPEAKRILKAVVKGEDATPKTEDELAPVIALEGLTKEDATAAFLQIEMGK